MATTGYRLVIAGDMHNFQRYRIPAGEFGAPEDIWHVVNGGGGAYLRRTDDIPDVSRMALGTSAPLAPEDFDCYPSREESSELFSGVKRWMPSWLLDGDASPYFRSFVVVDVAPERLRVRAFGVRDFDRASLESPPIWDEEIPLAPTAAPTPGLPASEADCDLPGPHPS